MANVVLSEVLCFVRHGINYLDFEELTGVLVKFCEVVDLTEAKIVLWRSPGVTGTMPNRRGSPNKSKAEFEAEDIVRCIAKCDENAIDLPLFAALDLSKLPPLKAIHRNYCLKSISHDLGDLVTRVKKMETAVCQDPLGMGDLVTRVKRIESVVCPEQDSLDDVYDTMRPITSDDGMVSDAALGSDVEDTALIDSSLNSTTRTRSPALHHQLGTSTSFDYGPDLSMLSALNMPEPKHESTTQHQSRHNNTAADGEGWRLVGVPKRRRLASLYIGRLHPDCFAADVAKHFQDVFGFLPEHVRCLVQRRDYVSFKLDVFYEDKEFVLRAKDAWPEYVEVREFQRNPPRA